MKRLLAIESSCDETAACVMTMDGKVESNIIASQIATHALYGGVVPEIASLAAYSGAARGGGAGGGAGGLYAAGY